MAECGECAYLLQGLSCPTVANGRTGEVILAAAYAFGYAFSIGMSYRVGVCLLFAVAASEASSMLVNLATQGDRPYWVDSSVEQVSCESNWGSTSPCVVAWTALVFTVVHLFPSVPQALRVAAGCAVSLACGWTQVCLGVHWPSQICASSVLGVIIAYTTSSFLDRDRLREEPEVVTLIGGGISIMVLVFCLAVTVVLMRMGGDTDWTLLLAGNACTKGWEGVVQVPVYLSFFRPWAACFSSILITYWIPAPAAPPGTAKVKLVIRFRGASVFSSFVVGNLCAFVAGFSAVVLLAATVEAGLDSNYAEYMSWEAATSFKSTVASAACAVAFLPLASWRAKSNLFFETRGDDLVA